MPETKSRKAWKDIDAKCWRYNPPNNLPVSTIKALCENLIRFELDTKAVE